tara:strand:+ start:143 stop:457 length:315 start_codon:yes stop_codon:yes gene_type:complete
MYERNHNQDGFGRCDGTESCVQADAVYDGEQGLQHSWCAGEDVFDGHEGGHRVRADEPSDDYVVGVHGEEESLVCESSDDMFQEVCGTGGGELFTDDEVNGGGL